MKLSKLTELHNTREMIDVFRGYNHNLRIGDGEFYDMENLTSADYPVLSPRPKRGVYVPTEGEKTTPTHPLGMIAKDKLCYVEANADGKTSTFYINGKPIEFESGDALNAESKTLISMGSYVIILPDKNYINTENHLDKGKIEKTIDIKSEGFLLEPCKLDGERYDIQYKGGTAPPLPKGKEEYDDLTLWFDISGETPVLKQYSKTNSEWVSIATTYIKMTFPNEKTDLTKLFANEDGITISGITNILNQMAPDNGPNNSATLREQLKILDNTMVVCEVGTNYIIVTGILEAVVPLPLTDTAYISLKRQMPIMDYIIESGNRLWGCRYGQALNGEIVNEIYASKLGDFKNWNTFAGISTDSYVASVGTDGKFTGAINHLGYPIFFKENYLHKVYGNYPANYQIQTTACRGVQRGCSKSLAIVNETLYYKSRSGICAYDGSLPVEISSALGDGSYDDAVAGVLGNKYYISMRDVNKMHHLFIYDAQKGMWHREDNTEALEFCTCDGELYYIDHATKDGAVQIKTIRGSGVPDTYPVKWWGITGLIGTDSPDKKYISRLIVRLSLEVGTRVFIFAQYDSCGAWEHLFTMNGTSLKTFSIPIRPKRCDHMRLKIEGEGVAKIYSITKTIEQGSDV